MRLKTYTKRYARNNMDKSNPSFKHQLNKLALLLFSSHLLENVINCQVIQIIYTVKTNSFELHDNISVHRSIDLLVFEKLFSWSFFVANLKQKQIFKLFDLFAVDIKFRIYLLSILQFRLK